MDILCHECGHGMDDHHLSAWTRGECVHLQDDPPFTPDCTCTLTPQDIADDIATRLAAAEAALEPFVNAYIKETELLTRQEADGEDSEQLLYDIFNRLDVFDFQRAAAALAARETEER